MGVGASGTCFWPVLRSMPLFFASFLRKTLIVVCSDLAGEQVSLEKGECVQVGHNSVELAMEWLIAHPEDPGGAGGAAASGAAAASEGEEQQLAQALAASLKAGEPSQAVVVRSPEHYR